MCNLFKCVHKACGCRLRQSSQLVRNQLFSPSRSCPLPHSPLNSVTICPLASFTSFLSLCHKNLNSSTPPDAMFSSGKRAKRGSCCRWVFQVGANCNREKQKREAPKSTMQFTVTFCLCPLTFPI